MKKISFYLVILVIFLSGCAGLGGKIANEADKEYISILTVPGKSKDQLYVNANTWFVDIFNSAESVIQYQDKDAGKIIGKYNFEHTVGIYNFRVKSTVEVNIKEGKARIRFYNPMYAVIGDSFNGLYPRAASYNSEMNVPNMQATRSNWMQLETELATALKQSSDW